MLSQALSPKTVHATLSILRVKAIHSFNVFFTCRPMLVYFVCKDKGNIRYSIKVGSVVVNCSAQPAAAGVLC